MAPGARKDGIVALLRPASIAIVGASADLNKLNGRPLKFLLRAGYKGRIFLVNPKYQEIAGLPCYPEVAAIPEDVDLAVVGVPARSVPETIHALGRKGVAAAIVFGSGFAEMGAEGAVLERTVAEAARSHGVRLCGPNTLGLINAFDNVLATFSQYANRDTPAGPVGFVTQSGAFGTAISALARRRGLGFGYFVNTGNEADVDFVTVMAEVLEDPRITVGAGYIEGLKDGDGFSALAGRAMALGKPLVVTKVGRTDAGARAAASHTGSLAGEDAVFDNVARQLGVIRTHNEEHMLDMAEAFATTPLPRGAGVGIVTQSGGAGVLMADRAEELGLRVPVLGDRTTEALSKVVPAFGSVGNPVDVTAQFIADPAILREGVKIVLADPRIDIAAVWFQLMEEFVDTLVAIFAELKQQLDKPFVVSWVVGPEAGITALRDLGICVLRGGEPMIDAIAGLVRYAADQRRWQSDAAARQAIALPAAGLPALIGTVPTVTAAGALAAHGIPLARIRVCATPEAAVVAAETIGYPVVMKIDSLDLPHKTEAGAVRTGLEDADAVKAAFAEIVGNAAAYRPDARIDGVIVQETARGDVELVVGLRRDSVFGMVVMAGLGGIFVEVERDVAFRRAPVTEAEAQSMLAQLRGVAILDGVRGRPPVDRDAVAALIAAVSRFGAANADRLEELDLNPVLAGPDGAVAVDWLMIVGEGRD